MVGISCLIQHRNPQSRLNTGLELLNIQRILHPLDNVFPTAFGRPAISDYRLGMVCDDAADDNLVLAKCEMDRQEPRLAIDRDQSSRKLESAAMMHAEHIRSTSPLRKTPRPSIMAKWAPLSWPRLAQQHSARETEPSNMDNIFLGSCRRRLRHATSFTHSQFTTMNSAGSWQLFRNIRLATLLTACLSATVAVAGNASPADASAKLVAEVLNSQKNALLQRTDFSRFTAELRTLYLSSQNNLLWLNPHRSPDALKAALELLNHADNQGLNPADYDAENLQRLLNSQPLEATNTVGYDTAVSAALLHYIHDLHEGRIRPQDLGSRNTFGNKATQNAVTAIKQALEQNLVAELPRQFEPKIKQYQRLKQGLADLRAQAPESAFQALQIDKSLRPGETHSQLKFLKQRLATLDAVAVDTASSSDIYEGALVDSIKSLQLKHGLQADGIIGKDTLALLNQTRTEKIRQIELAMERLRWLPGDLEGPLIIFLILMRCLMSIINFVVGMTKAFPRKKSLKN